METIKSNVYGVEMREQGMEIASQIRNGNNCFKFIVDGMTMNIFAKEYSLIAYYPYRAPYNPNGIQVDKHRDCSTIHFVLPFVVKSNGTEHLPDYIKQHENVGDIKPGEYVIGIPYSHAMPESFFYILCYFCSVAIYYTLAEEFNIKLAYGPYDCIRKSYPKIVNIGGKSVKMFNSGYYTNDPADVILKSTEGSGFLHVLHLQREMVRFCGLNNDDFKDWFEHDIVLRTSGDSFIETPLTEAEMDELMLEKGFINTFTHLTNDSVTCVDRNGFESNCLYDQFDMIFMESVGHCVTHHIHEIEKMDWNSREFIFREMMNGYRGARNDTVQGLRNIIAYAERFHECDMLIPYYKGEALRAHVREISKCAIDSLS